MLKLLHLRDERLAALVASNHHQDELLSIRTRIENLLCVSNQGEHIEQLREDIFQSLLKPTIPNDRLEGSPDREDPLGVL